jgi:hypothetical protein
MNAKCGRLTPGGRALLVADAGRTGDALLYARAALDNVLRGRTGERDRDTV